MSAILLEKHPHKDFEKTYYNIKGDGDNWKKVVIPNKERNSLKDAVVDMFTAVFLPRGFPDSVSSDYIAYQTWDSLQALGSSVTSTLATHNVLKGIGVGDKSASVMSATITWLLKDGTGMLGRIGFTYLKGSSLDIDCKKWRLTADIINDAAIGIDMISPLFSSQMMLVQCITGFMKSLVGTIGGATRAALTQHQARNNNLADVSAKDGSQETLCNLTALIISLVIMPIISESDATIWTLFFILTFFHIYCNYRAVRAVNIEVFNPSRLALFIRDYHFKGINSGQCSIAEINGMENVWFFHRPRYSNFVQAGVPLKHHIKNPSELQRAFNRFKEADYLLTFDPYRPTPVYISFYEGKDTPTHKLKALFHAYFLYHLCTPTYIESLLSSGTISNRTEIGDYILATTSTEVLKIFPDFLSTAQSKRWNIQSLLFLEEGWRLSLIEDKFD